MSFFANKRLIIVLVGLVLLITVMGFTSKERATLTWPEMFTKDVFSVVQGIFYRPAQAFSAFVQDVKSAYNVYEENRALKASLDQYAQMTAELAHLQSENAELRDRLQAHDRLKNSYQLRFAEVVARSADYWNNSLTIDQGKQNGIKKDMAVITSGGLIGRISSVSNFSSTVELLTNVERSNHISATIYRESQVNGQKSYARVVDGVLEEYDTQHRLLIMRKIPQGAKIEEKQLVITSGKGGVMPSGLSIGYVVKVQPDVLGLTQTAYIQPTADFSQINQVFVVERAYVVTPAGELLPSNQVDATGMPINPAQTPTAPGANPQTTTAPNTNSQTPTGGGQ